MKKMLFLFNHSLRYKFTITIVLIVLIPLSLAYFHTYYNTYHTLRENTEEHLINSVYMIGEHLESQFHMINQTSMLLLSNNTIRSALNTPSKDDPYLKIQKTTTIDRELKNLLLFNYAWDNKLIKSVFIFEDESTHYMISRDSVNSNFREKYLNMEKYLLPSHKEMAFIPPSKEDATIYLIRNMNDLNTQHRIGILVLAIDVKSLSQIDHNLVTYNDIEIVSFNHEGVIFTHTDATQLGQPIGQQFLSLGTSSRMQEITINNEIYLAASMKINNYQLNSIVAVPKNEVFYNLTTTMKRSLISIIIILFLALMIGLYVSSRVINPLKLITSITEKVKDGNFHEKLPPSKYIELNQLNIVFNNMIDEIDYLINEVYEKQLLLKESELTILQSQINPHFFFNVLETISWEARFSHNDKIYKMITSLGQLMRACINLNNLEKITIGEELDYVQHYLSLQKVRFEDRLSTSINILDESVKSYYLPKLCILPIVENALIHGLEKKRGDCQLIIRLEEKENKLFFEIIDDGIGFHADKLNFKNLDTIKERKSKRNGIGLYNSNKRTQLIYGDRYGLSIESKIHVGTKVTLCIPIDKGGNENVPCYDC